MLKAMDTSTFAGFRAIKRINVNLKEGAIKLEAHETKTRRAKTVPISSKTSKLLADYMKESKEFGEGLLFLTYDWRPVLANS